ncbi:MAG: FTR1 family protein [Chloroflexi bacterium]|nr:FTR1 family protein [Chloroflexota bacterium]
MDIGFLLTGLLTGLREGVEAALIVSIVLAYLAKTGNARHFGKIWLGTVLAVAVSIAVGVTLFVTIGGFEGAAEQIFEGVAMTIAAGVVTWMLFWMRRTAANIKGQLHARVDRSLTEGSIFGLTLLAFTAVIREGIETALFLLGQAGGSPERAYTVGFCLGGRISLLQAASDSRLAGVITVGTSRAFDISGVLPHDPAVGPAGVVGSILRAIFGYSSTPEWITLITWVAYVAIVLALYLRPLKPSTATRAPEQRVAGA